MFAGEKYCCTCGEYPKGRAALEKFDRKAGKLIRQALKEAVKEAKQANRWVDEDKVIRTTRQLKAVMLCCIAAKKIKVCDRDRSKAQLMHNTIPNCVASYLSRGATIAVNQMDQFLGQVNDVDLSDELAGKASSRHAWAPATPTPTESPQVHTESSISGMCEF